MYQYDDPTAVALMPAPAAAGQPGWFSDGSPTTGQPATILRADFMNAVQAELLNILSAAGVAPSKAVQTQVATAIQTLIRTNMLCYAVDAGVANTYQVPYSPAVTQLVDGMVLSFRAKTGNSGASTFSPNGLAAKPIYSQAHSALAGGEIIVNGFVEVEWNSALNGWVLCENSGGMLAASSVALPSGAANGVAYLNASKVLTTSSALQFDGNNMSLGTPSAWGGGYKGVEIGSAALMGNGTDSTARLLNNAYYDGTNYRYKANGTANFISLNGGSPGYSFFTANPGTAGNVISFTQAMTLDGGGNLFVGVTSGNHHILGKQVTADAGNLVFDVYNTLNGVSSFVAYGVSSFGPNAANSAAKVGKDATTNRSINAGGTINASGADYAEYENNNGLTIPKGQIVGFKADGSLTLTYAEAIRFGIKSTNPSYVGGDVWGREEVLGFAQPVKPVLDLPDYEGPLAPEPIDDTASDDDQRAFAAALAQYASAQEAYAASVQAAQLEFDSVTMPAFESALAEFQAKLELARKQVDRVAYSGKVPVNLMGAAPGDYVVALPAADGSITGAAVAKGQLTFAQYQDAVGRVNCILADGRAEVAVIVH